MNCLLYIVFKQRSLCMKVKWSVVITKLRKKTNRVALPLMLNREYSRVWYLYPYLLYQSHIHMRTPPQCFCCHNYFIFPSPQSLYAHLAWYCTLSASLDCDIIGIEVSATLLFLSEAEEMSHPDEVCLSRCEREAPSSRIRSTHSNETLRKIRSSSSSLSSSTCSVHPCPNPHYHYRCSDWVKVKETGFVDQVLPLAQSLWHRCYQLQLQLQHLKYSPVEWGIPHSRVNNADDTDSVLVLISRVSSLCVGRMREARKVNRGSFSRPNSHNSGVTPHFNTHTQRTSTTNALRRWNERSWVCCTDGTSSPTHKKHNLGGGGGLNRIATT